MENNSKVDETSEIVAPQPVINHESELRGCFEGLAKLLVTILEIIAAIALYALMTSGSIQVKSDCIVIKLSPIMVDTCTIIPAQ